MSNCIPCSPCNTNCPDDWEILSVDILDPEDCNTNCCWKSCSDNKWINIQSTNDCLTVDTSECGVVKLTAKCPKPTYVKAWDNVTVRDVTPPDDCYIDWGDCGIDGWWEVSATDEKVKACSWDTTPGYLNQKLVAWNWINITEVGCDGNTDSKLRISVDPDVYDNTDEMVAVSSNCSPWYLEDVLVVNSNYIKAENVGCKLIISDKTPKLHYAKVYLASDWRSPSIPGMTQGWSTILWNTWSNPSDFQTELLSWMTVTNQWFIRAERRWLYIIWFSGSIELSYWIHWLRAQLYRTDATQGSYYTVIESRYSWPLWEQPYQIMSSWQGIWAISYVSNVTGGSGDSAPSVSRATFNIDTPLISEQTESWWQAWHWKSQSLWAFVDRVPFGWTTIAILNKWDLLAFWVKANTEVNPDWSLLWRVPSEYKYWQLAVLWRSGESDLRIGGEPWVQIFASLLQPLS